MLLQMSIQVGLLPETSFAEGTFERFLLVVNISYMSLQIRADGEGPLAIFAFVGLFPGMRS